MEGGRGSLPSLPCGGGGERGGLVHPALSPASLERGHRCTSCSLLMIRVGRPLNLLLLLMGPGPSSLLHSTRSNKSSYEGDTFPRLVRRRVAAVNHGELFLALVPPLVPLLACSCWQKLPHFWIPILSPAHVFLCADSSLSARMFARLGAACRLGGSRIPIGLCFLLWPPWTSFSRHDWPRLVCGFFLHLARRLLCPCFSFGLLAGLRSLDALVGRVRLRGCVSPLVTCFRLRKHGEPRSVCS